MRLHSLGRVLRLLALTTLAFSFTAAAADLSPAYRAAATYESGGDVAPLRQIEQWVRQSVDNEAMRIETESGLAGLLQGQATFEAKRFACQQLAVIGREGCVPALTALLGKPETVGIACLALASNPAAAAGAALRKQLDTATGRDQAQIAHALGVRRDAKAAAPLSKLARASNPEAAEAAVIALGKIETSPAQKTLAALRKDCPDPLRRTVADASLTLAAQLAAKGKLRDATAIYTELVAPSQPDDIRRGAFGGLLRLDNDGGEQRMLRALSGQDAAVKPVAIAALPALQREGASQQFAAQLPRLAPFEQTLLIQALSVRGDPPARAAVREQLTAADAGVRLAAIKAEGETGDASSVPPLAGALRKLDAPAEQKAVEVALSALKGGGEVDQAIAAQLRNRMAGPKAPLLAALVRRANPESVPMFLAETASSDPVMAKLAFQGLNRTGSPKDLPAVLTALGNLKTEAVLEDAQAAVGQMLRRGDAPAQNAAAVREALSATPGIRGLRAYLPLLALCPDAEGLSLVRTAAGDANPEVRDLGLRTLADWPDASAWDTLLALYQQAAGDPQRVVALRGLSRLLGEQNAKPDTQLIARYRDLLAGAKTEGDRKLVLGALAGCAHPDALQLAVEQLRQAGVRAEAESAVKRIAEAIKAAHPQVAEAALLQLK